MADIIVLPVIRINRPDEGRRPVLPLPASVTDINVFRWRRDIADHGLIDDGPPEPAPRRSKRSLLRE